MPKRLRSLSVSLGGKVESLSLAKELLSGPRCSASRSTRSRRPRRRTASCWAASDQGLLPRRARRNGEPRADIEVPLTLTLLDFTDPLPGAAQDRCERSHRARGAAGCQARGLAARAEPLAAAGTRELRDRIVTGTAGQRAARVPFRRRLQPDSAPATASRSSRCTETRPCATRPSTSRSNGSRGGYAVLQGACPRATTSSRCPVPGVSRVRITSRRRARRLDRRQGPDARALRTPHPADRSSSRADRGTLSIAARRATTRAHACTSSRRAGCPRTTPSCRLHAVDVPIGATLASAATAHELSTRAARSATSIGTSSRGATRRSIPGNMLARPGVLLNPWELRPSDESTSVSKVAAWRPGSERWRPSPPAHLGWLDRLGAAGMAPRRGSSPTSTSSQTAVTDARQSAPGR